MSLFKSSGGNPDTMVEEVVPMVSGDEVRPDDDDSESKELNDEEKKERNIAKCVKKGVCTLKATGENYVVQKYYICNTCDFDDGSAVCESCKNVCHKSHECVESDESPGKFYCDCGINKKNCKCVGKKIKFDH